jgi:predicted AAA+ superfamily ATPase
MKRELTPLILNDLEKKIVLITGPRQCGKTTLSKALFSNYQYFNYDLSEHRVELSKKTWDRNADLVVFDELHKMKNWKSWLKGIYDTEGVRPRLLVTGSAKLDSFRKVGDSLAGRYFQFRLHPLCLKELRGVMPAGEAFERLLIMGGFPEPFFENRESFYKRWRKTHLDIILRQDLIDLEAIRDIQAIETLVELLRHRVGSPVSYSSLARDLERDPKTVKRWLSLLENLYIIFRVSPYHNNGARMLLKEPKYYFFDNAQVAGDKGAKLENLVANSLKRELDWLEDSEGLKTSLHFVRNKDAKEVDFLLALDKQPTHLIEVKWSDQEPAKSLLHFAHFWPGVKTIQLLRELGREKSLPNGIELKRAEDWLSELNLAYSNPKD